MRRRAASVVVPTRGGAARLPVLLAALAAQDTHDFEVVVVIDGDVDGSEPLVREWGDRLDVRPVVFTQNRGRSAALNAGALRARGRVLIRCDDDLEPRPDFVSGHVSRHEGTASGVVGLTTNAFPDTPYARAYGRKANARTLAAALALPSHRTWRLWSANVSVPADIHARIGGYDERYRRYGWEDVDYGYRLHRAGLPVVVAPELVAVHHGASTTTAARALRALHSGAARETFAEAHGPDAVRALDGESDAGQPGPWERLVGAASSVATERTLRVYGRAVDAAIPRLPERLGEKLVALAVEAGGLAGLRYPNRARATF